MKHNQDYINIITGHYNRMRYFLIKKKITVLCNTQLLYIVLLCIAKHGEKTMLIEVFTRFASNRAALLN